MDDVLLCNVIEGAMRCTFCHDRVIIADAEMSQNMCYKQNNFVSDSIRYLKKAPCVVALAHQKR